MHMNGIPIPIPPGGHNHLSSANSPSLQPNNPNIPLPPQMGNLLRFKPDMNMNPYSPSVSAPTSEGNMSGMDLSNYQHQQQVHAYQQHIHQQQQQQQILMSAASLYNSYDQLRLGWIPSDSSLTGTGIIPVPYK
jgi:hypothetical protein